MTAFDYAGRFTWGPVQGVEQVTITRSRGISPSVCQVVVPRKMNFPTGSSVILFSDGQNSFRMNDCILGDIAYDGSNGERWVLTIYDYRWKWAMGRINGRYNFRRGGKLVEKRKKKPSDLAKLCFEQMGVTRFDTSAMPDDVYPEVNWDLTVPANALQELCNTIGCVICPQLDGSVHICKLGEGRQLPTMRGGEVKESLDLAEAPDEVWMQAAPNSYEISIEIGEPLGLEENGQIKPWNELSYKPDNGWGFEDPRTLDGIPKKHRKYALQSLYRWYQLKLPIKIPSLPFDVTDIDQILPILDYRLERAKAFVSGERVNSAVEQEERQKAWMLYGRFWPLKDIEKHNVTSFSHDFDGKPELIYDGDFEIDQIRGFIKFSDPIFQIVTRQESGGNESRQVFDPPRLFLRTTVNIYDAKSGAAYRHVVKLPTGRRNGTKPHHAVEQSVRREVIIKPGEQAVKSDNKTQLEAELKKYGQLIVRKFVPKPVATGTYSGFQPIELDGAIAQVTYEIDSEGYTLTTASRNAEHSEQVPSFEARLRAAAVNDMLNRQKVVSKSSRRKEEEERD
jgi:hypothetical protein